MLSSCANFGRDRYHLDLGHRVVWKLDIYIVHLPETFPHSLDISLACTGCARVMKSDDWLCRRCSIWRVVEVDTVHIAIGSEIGNVSLFKV